MHDRRHRPPRLDAVKGQRAQAWLVVLVAAVCTWGLSPLVVKAVASNQLGVTIGWYQACLVVLAARVVRPPHDTSGPDAGDSTMDDATTFALKWTVQLLTVLALSYMLGAIL